MKRTGKVWLIGAGPGDPELLTLKAARAIGECDALFVDDLVNPAVLAHAKPGARIVPVGKRAGCRSTPQAFIERHLARFARAGFAVGRVKGGDPFVFGRGGEEMLAMRRAGVAVEVVAGITAGIAAPASFGIPVTHRDLARGVTFLTGHTRAGTQPHWEALARSQTTLVWYMGLAALPRIAAGLLAGGMDPATPACAISRATLPEAAMVASTLARLPHDAAGLPGPALIVIGKVVELAHARELEDVARSAA